MLSSVFQGQVDLASFFKAILVTLVIAWLAAGGVRRLLAAGLRGVVRDTIAESSPLIRGPLRLAGAATFLLVVSILLFPAFQMAGLRPRAGIQPREIAAWTFGPGLHVVL